MPATPVLSIANTTIANNVAQAGNDPTTPFGFAEGQGGGVFSSSNLTISASTLTGNQAVGPASSSQAPAGFAQGGGLYNAGTATISTTVIAANRAVGGAGTIALSSGAGGAGGGAKGVACSMSAVP